VRTQDQCRARPVEHVTLALDGMVYSGIHDALNGDPITLDCFAL